MVGDVVAGVGRHAGESPGVRSHQLGVGVDRHAHRPLVRGGVGDVQAEQAGTEGIGREVGAGEPQPRRRRQLEARVAPSAEEPGRGSDPPTVDAEPDPVEELQRGRPHPAHLAVYVPAVGVEAPILEPRRVGPLSRRDLAAILQAAAGGALLGCRGRLSGASCRDADGLGGCPELDAGSALTAATPARATAVAVLRVRRISTSRLDAFPTRRHTCRSLTPDHPTACARVRGVGPPRPRTR